MNVLNGSKKSPNFKAYDPQISSTLGLFFLIISIVELIIVISLIFTMISMYPYSLFQLLGVNKALKLSVGHE